MIGWMLDQAIDWILDAVRDSLNLVWQLLASTLFHLPDVTALPQVQALTARALLVVNTGYVLAIAVTAVAVMTHGSLQIRYGAGDLLPRLVIGLVAANFATIICVTIIDTANTLVLALSGQGIASTDALEQLRRISTQQLTDPVAALLAAVIGLILVVLVVLLMTGWITRFVVLVVLCGIAPLALACHGTPWSDGLARLWWQVMGGVCATVVLQAVALNTSLSILLSPSANLTTFAGPDRDGLLNLLVVAVLLWMTVRIPALVGRYLTQNGHRQNLFGALVRLVIAQQVTRGLGTALRRSTVLRPSTGAAPGVHRGGARHPRWRSTGNSWSAVADPPRRPGAPTARRPPTGSVGQHRGGTTSVPGSSRPRPTIPEGVNPASVFGNRPRSRHVSPPAAPGSPARAGTPRTRPPAAGGVPPPARPAPGAARPPEPDRPRPPRRTPPPDRSNP